jgi:hypothetical protein
MTEIIPTDELEVGNRLVDMWLEAIADKDDPDRASVEYLTMQLLPDPREVAGWKVCGCTCHDDDDEIPICESQIRYTQSMALMLAVALRRLAAK